MYLKNSYFTKTKLLVANYKLYVEEIYFGGEKKKLILIELTYVKKDTVFVRLGVTI